MATDSCATEAKAFFTSFQINIEFYLFFFTLLSYFLSYLQDGGHVVPVDDGSPEDRLRKIAALLIVVDCLGNKI